MVFASKTSNHFGGAGGTGTRVESRLCAAATEELAFRVHPEVVAVLQRVAPATCPFVVAPPPPTKQNTHNSVSFLWAASACLGNWQTTTARSRFRTRPTKSWQGVLVLLGPQAVVTLAAFWLPSTSPTVMHLQQCIAIQPAIGTQWFVHRHAATKEMKETKLNRKKRETVPQPGLDIQRERER